mmetsp:Transcript_83767/g.200979  ORF Transcript_83767/g.200979 Transcript_83767/m.200979 type:complete len:234 (-) Transcript_83767:696-1397(-)
MLTKAVKSNAPTPSMSASTSKRSRSGGSLHPIFGNLCLRSSTVSIPSGHHPSRRRNAARNGDSASSSSVSAATMRIVLTKQLSAQKARSRGTKLSRRGEEPHHPPAGTLAAGQTPAALRDLPGDDGDSFPPESFSGRLALGLLFLAMLEAVDDWTDIVPEEARDIEGFLSLSSFLRRSALAFRAGTFPFLACTNHACRKAFSAVNDASRSAPAQRAMRSAAALLTLTPRPPSL